VLFYTDSPCLAGAVFSPHLADRRHVNAASTRSALFDGTITNSRVASELKTSPNSRGGHWPTHSRQRLLILIVNRLIEVSMVNIVH
jgi:hypothetical protein